MTPKFIINIWTLIIRPVFDYAFCLAKLKNKTGENLYIAEELQSFKKLMSLRRSTSNQLIRNLIGYDPEKLCQEIIRRADAKWSERKGPNINDILIEGYEVHEKIKKSESARKGKLYKFVQQRIEKYETVIKEILDSFKCDK